MRDARLDVTTILVFTAVAAFLLILTFEFWLPHFGFH